MKSLGSLEGFGDYESVLIFVASMMVLKVEKSVRIYAKIFRRYFPKNEKFLFFLDWMINRLTPMIGRWP